MLRKQTVRVPPHDAAKINISALVSSFQRVLRAVLNKLLQIRTKMERVLPLFTTWKRDEEEAGFFFYTTRIQLARLFLKRFLSSISRRRRRRDSSVPFLPYFVLLRFLRGPFRGTMRCSSRGCFTDIEGGGEIFKFIPTRIDGK